MSGTVCGIIDCKTSSQQYYKDSRDFFKKLFDFFNTHPNATRVALRYGSGGTGTGYWDSGTPFGGAGAQGWHNAYAVFRMNTSAARTWPYYVMILMQEGGASTFFADGVSMNNAVGSGGVVISVAAGIGGDQNPWNGTTNNDGTDAVPTTPWKVPTGGTGVAVIPGSNNAPHAHATNKNNFIIVGPYQLNGFGSQFGGGSDFGRFGFMGDSDTFVVYWDQGDDGIFDRLTVVTPYTPLYAASCPLICLTDSQPINGFRDGYTYPTNVSTGAGLPSGGVMLPDASAAIGRYGGAAVLMVPDYMTNPVAAMNYYTNKYAAHPLWFRSVGYGVGDLTYGGGGATGYIPTSNLALVQGTNRFDLSTDKKWIFYGGHATTTAPQVGYPYWDGATLPRTATTRDGVAFSRAP